MIRESNLKHATTDAERCNGIIRGSMQCNMQRVEGGKFCVFHGGGSVLHKQQERSLYKFRLDQYKNRFETLSDSSAIKNLRDEIAVLRLLVQSRFNQIMNSDDMLMHSSQVSRLVKAIASLGESCAKIETSLDDVMDRQSATDIVASLFNAIPNITQQLFEDTVVLLERFNKSEKSPTLQIQTRWSKDLGTFLTTERVISIRGEIGVLRMILEERLNASITEYDLVINSPQILDNIQDIEKLVLACHRLEASQGILLNTTQAQAFASELITIIGNHVPAADLEAIANTFGAGHESK